MNPYIPKLLSHIPSGLPIGDDVVPALQINGSGYLSLSGTTLYITVSNQSYSFDLYDTTVGDLADTIGGDLSVSLLQDGIVELLQLSNGETFATLPCTLYLPADETYFVLGMMARVLEGRKRSRISAAAQVNLQAAVTRFLDWWGASTGISRYQGEPDVIYAQRIINMRFRPMQNNIALENLFSTLGYTAQVLDTAYGKFSVQVHTPPNAPDGFLYTPANLFDITSAIKASGTLFDVIMYYVIQATVHISASSNESIVVNRISWANAQNINVLDGTWKLDGSRLLSGNAPPGPSASSSISVTVTCKPTVSQSTKQVGFFLDGNKKLDGTWNLSGTTTQTSNIGVTVKVNGVAV